MPNPPSSPNDHNLYLRPPIWLPLAVATLLGVFYLAGKTIESRDSTPATISVSGEGKVSAVPDIAVLSFGVQTGRVPTAQDATARLQKTMTAILDAVKEKGIEEKDISTESLSLYPAYDWTDGGQIPRGFEASQSLRVKIRDLSKIGEVLSTATTAGANQIGGVTFTVDEPEALRTQAREKAIVQAKEKALKLASELGVTLGKLKGFSEGYGGTPPVMYERAMGMGGGGDIAPLPVPTGEQELSTTVTLTYEIR
jgi:uncharacterized protein YggE